MLKWQSLSQQLGWSLKHLRCLVYVFNGCSMVPVKGGLGTFFDLPGSARTISGRKSGKKNCQ